MGNSGRNNRKTASIKGSVLIACTKLSSNASKMKVVKKITKVLGGSMGFSFTLTLHNIDASNFMK